MYFVSSGCIYKCAVTSYSVWCVCNIYLAMSLKLYNYTNSIVRSGPVYVITNYDVIITSHINNSTTISPCLLTWCKGEGSSLSSSGRLYMDMLV